MKILEKIQYAFEATKSLMGAYETRTWTHVAHDTRKTTTATNQCRELSISTESKVKAFRSTTSTRIPSLSDYT